MNFLGLGLPEIILIVLVILLFFGKDKLPELARGIGRSVKELKSGFTDTTTESSEKKTKDDAKK